MDGPRRIAAICTIYHPCSHADAIVTKFLKGMSTDEACHAPEVEIAALYIDHVLENDIGLELARHHGVPVYPSIRRALHAGTGRLAVDGVLLVGEHGDYPWNERGRHMYPRRYFFEQIAGVMAESGRVVPVFNDKHFAYDFADARWMWDRARQLGIPLMAGSCLPLAWLNPWFMPALGTPLQGALALGYGGIEAYGYHTLETLQCMVERRPGGESGVVAVQCLEGNEVWAARERGEWPGDLGEAAWNAIDSRPSGRMEDLAQRPAVFLIEHADGLRSTALMLDEGVHQWSYAARLDDQIRATEFFLQPDGPGANFGYLCRNIQRFFQTGVAPYRADRTLLATGVIDAAMNSRYEGHRRLETPWLDLSYVPLTELPERPRGPRPCGASLARDAPDLLLPWRT